MDSQNKLLSELDNEFLMCKIVYGMTISSSKTYASLRFSNGSEIRLIYIIKDFLSIEMDSWVPKEVFKVFISLEAEFDDHGFKLYFRNIDDLIAALRKCLMA